MKKRLDLFGILVLSFAAANAGGILRDVLIGAVPPAALQDGRYVAVSVLAGLVVVYWLPAVASGRIQRAVLVCDAIGLSLFAVAGTKKALSYDLGLVAAPLLGMLTGVGGGVVRDVLLADVPAVLRREIYAVAALAAAVVVVAGSVLRWPETPVALAAAVLCLTLRLISIRRGWNLPAAQEEP
jgi:uncharacterized membrane protein YeiH